MKKTSIVFALIVTLFISTSLRGVEIKFSNFDNLGNVLAIVDSQGSLLGDTSTVSIGFFNDPGFIQSGNFSDFEIFGTTNFATVGAFSENGLFWGSSSADIDIGSIFHQEQISIFITNSTGDEWLLTTTNEFFPADVELTNPTDTVDISLSGVSASNYLFGGASGPSVEIQNTTFPSISTSPVPEPSTYALFAGIMVFGFIVVRRRARARV